MNVLVVKLVVFDAVAVTLRTLIFGHHRRAYVLAKRSNRLQTVECWLML